MRPSRLLATVVCASILKCCVVAAASEAIRGENLPDLEMIMTSLDLERPSLAPVKAAWERGDDRTAARELAGVLRERARRPREGWDGPWERASNPRYRTHADNLLQNRFPFSDRKGNTQFVFVGETVDWMGLREFGKKQDLGMYPFNFLYQGLSLPLLQTYFETGEDKYARACLDFMRDWIRRIRPSSPGFPYWYKNILWFRNIYSGMQNTQQLLNHWPGLTVDDSMLLLQSLIEQTQWQLDQTRALLRNRDKVPRNRRHRFASAPGAVMYLLRMAEYLPELKLSGEIRAEAPRQLEVFLGEIYSPDGALKYGSPGYHRVVSRWALQCPAYLKSVGAQVPPRLSSLFRDMRRYELRLYRPDGSLPPFGDTGDHHGRQRIETGLQEFGREEVSFGFPYAGWYVMRSDWSPNALYAALDAGPMGESHGHQDKLHLEVWAYGKSLLCDPGTTYRLAGVRSLLVATQCHNTLTVDGLGQVRPPGWTEHPLQNDWITSEGFDFIEGSFEDGYGKPSRGSYHGSGDPILRHVSHRRSVFFVRSEYWIVWDRVLGAGRHRVEANWQFFPRRITSDPEKGHIRSADLKGANVILAVARPAQFGFSQVIGQEAAPHRGWVFGPDPHYDKAPTAQVTYDGRLPMDMATIVYPYPKPSEPADVRVDRLDARRSGKTHLPHEALALRVRLWRRPQEKPVTDTFLLASDRTEMEVDGVYFEGEALLLRRNAQGDCRRILMKRGTKVTVDKEALIECEPVAPAVCVRWDAGRAHIEAPGVRRIRMRAAGITGVVWEGEEYPPEVEQRWILLAR